MSYGRRNRWMGGHCGCGPKRIVHPTKHEVVNCCTEEMVEHIHPIHTTVCNHHIIKNQHVFPHTVSQEQSVEEVNMTAPVGPGMMGPGMVDPGMMGPGMGGPGMMGPGMGGPGMVGPGMMGPGHDGWGKKCCSKKKWC
ncbi:spore coat protein [Aciduricibacillus chroicocephali]|uniref:Spore coat protein n=1 Tax=Aciduricibacillus chroicocephali TaxID=3054939 RepID=A0ABY9KXG2_9BACI|nr:spore coat protein [Bacillaceae bacterium 44XB]